MPQENDDDTQEETPLIKQLRQQLKEQGDQIANLTTSNRDLTGQTTLAAAGFSYLNPTQQQAVMRMMGETEVTPDSVTATATSLGYQPYVPQQTPTGDQPQEQPQAYPQTPQVLPQVPFQPQQQAIPPVQLPSGQFTGYPPANGQAPPPNPVALSAEAMHQMTHAQQYGQPSPQQSFNDKLLAAKSAEEVTALIRSEGQQHGMIHEFDVE